MSEQKVTVRCRHCGLFGSKKSGFTTKQKGDTTMTICSRCGSNDVRIMEAQKR